jgi:MFS superfamily sulfate permease-like transporter
MKFNSQLLSKDISASIAVFLVAMPLCLGIALASGAPIISGLIAGIVGGIVVGLISGSHTSVTGPAAGLTSVVLVSITKLGSFETFLLAVCLAGVFQTILGILKVGNIAAFFPTSVIKGLLAAIGIIIILKQIPHALGYDADAEGDFSFSQADGQNTFSEILELVNKFTPGAVIISMVGLVILIFWETQTQLRKSIVSGSLVAVLAGVLINAFLTFVFPELALQDVHLVKVPVFNTISESFSSLSFPDFTQIQNSKVWIVAVTVAIIASVETLLNIEAIDKLDPRKRKTPANRELIAQGIGNFISGLAGGIPLTSVVIRGTVNINAHAHSKWSTIFHGMLILILVIFIPNVLNLIPLASLAAILLYTGYKLVNPQIFKQMLRKGRIQYLPFFVTIIAIVFTDLLMGVLIGLAFSIFFILKNNYSYPFFSFPETYHKESILRIKLAQQLTYLNRASLILHLKELKPNQKIILDGTSNIIMDEDVKEVLVDFIQNEARQKNIKIDIQGFDKSFPIDDKHYTFHTTTKELQNLLSPEDIITILKNGNDRFVKGKTIDINYRDQVLNTQDGQHPLAIVLGCIDSRSAPEIIFDMGIGDIFSVRMAGNVANEDVLASIEFACKVLGAKVIVVLGHSECGAIKGACDNANFGHLPGLLNKIKLAIEMEKWTVDERNSSNKNFVQNVTNLHIHNTKEYITTESTIISDMLKNNQIKIISGWHNLKTGVVEFLD